MSKHFDTNSEFELKTTIHKLNSFLPNDITVFDVIKVHDDAHARFDATKRSYEYHIHNFKDSFLEDLSWYYHQNLDLQLMNEASKILLNHTDCQAFSKVNTDVNTFDCKIFQACWIQINNQLIFTITADRFLRNMVRAIVGTLVYVGLKKISIDDFENIIKSKNRNNAGFSVPAQGLFLTKIEYDYIK